MNKAGLPILVVLAGIAHTAYPYELATHAHITQQAYLQSMLVGDKELFGQLGLNNKEVLGGKEYDTGASPYYYYDISANVIKTRYADEFSLRHMPELAVKENENIRLSLTAQGWLLRGAIREDDYPFGPNPWDDPVNEYRPLNHFYDPIGDRPLTVVGALGKKAIDWALGTDNSFLNHYTIRDAREAMYRALTGKTKEGQDAGPNNTKATEKDRKAYWATTFRALGDVVHLVEDMAQPQHTRNDPHAGRYFDGTPGKFGHRSVYEFYTDARAKGESFFTVEHTTALPTPIIVPTLPLKYDAYAVVPRFNDYRAYFTTRDSQTDILARQGLADYSNRGFFTAGKNLGNTEYALPNNDPNAYVPTEVSMDWTGATLLAKATLLLGSVPDSLAGGQPATGIPLTTHSIWDQFLQVNQGKSTYTLNRYNYDAMADLLIPRAVAYSAGLIDYFFRGRMEINLPEERVYGIIDHATPHTVSDGIPYDSTTGKVFGYTKIKLTLKNTTPNIVDGNTTHPQKMTGGRLTAVAKYRRNACYEPDLSGEPNEQREIPSGCAVFPDPNNPGGRSYLGSGDEISVSQAIDNVMLDNDPEAAPQPFTFDFSDNPIPINVHDLYLQVVYRGALGNEEDAVVVATKDIAEPTYISVLNSTDSFWLVDQRYDSGTIKGNAALEAKFGQQRCYLETTYREPLRDVQYGFRKGYVATKPLTLDVGQHTRAAVLRDKGPFTLWLTAKADSDSAKAACLGRTIGGLIYDPWPVTLPALESQVNPDDNNLQFWWITKSRGIYRFNVIVHMNSYPTNNPYPDDLPSGFDTFPDITGLSPVKTSIIFE